MDDKVNIVKVDEQIDYDDRGTPISKMRVQFKVGPHGPFVRTFDKDGFNATAVKQALDAFARELATLQR